MTLDRLGERIETKASALAAWGSGSPAKEVALGVALALIVIAGGILAFVAVFLVLVEGFA